MTMSDRRDNPAGRNRWGRRLTGLALLAAGSLAVIPAQGALAAAPPNPATAIQAAYAQAFSGGTPAAQNLAAVDDGPALAGALKQAVDYFPAANQPSTVSVSDVKPQGLLNAQVRFNVTYTGGYAIGERNGTAVVSGGRWKVSRETFCSVLGLAGAVCPPRAGLPPLNQAAARTAITQAFARAFTGGEEPAYGLGAVQDGPALASTLAQAIKNFPAATASSRVSTSDIVFTNPWNAWLQFHITYPTDNIDFGQQAGTAVVDQGQWKVSRQTYCLVMSWAGATCPR